MPFHLCYNQVFVAPEEAELHRALADAADAANKGNRVRKVEWTPGHTRDAWNAIESAPEGFHQWTGLGRQKRKTSGSDTCSAVAIAWWTDPLGRRHLRVGGERVYMAFNRFDNLFVPWGKRPPLWVVYPEHVYFRDKSGEQPCLICRCGATGTLASLGWMGPHCAACHDRLEEGTLPAEAGEPVTTVLGGRDSSLGRVLFSPDGTSVISGARSGAGVCAWGLSTGEPIDLRGLTSARLPLDLSRQGDRLAVAKSSAQVDIVSWPQGSPEKSLYAGARSRELLDLVFSPDGTHLAVAPYGQVELYDLRDRSRVVVASNLTAHFADRYLAFSPDGQTLAVAHGFRSGLLLWDLSAQKSRTLTLPGVNYGCDGIAFSPDGQLLGVVVDRPGNVIVCTATHGSVHFRLDSVRASSLAFSPDGRLLAVNHAQGLELYAVSDGRPLGSWCWHTQGINDVAFSPDGRWIATASDDGMVKLWPVAGLLATVSASAGG